MIFLGVDVKWQQAARDYKCVGGMLFPAFCFAYWSGELGIFPEVQCVFFPASGKENMETNNGFKRHQHTKAM